MSFNPPPTPFADQQYQYGNVIWQFDGTAGVWNIVDGSLVGEQGPQGPQGPQGVPGIQGDPGAPSVGDGAAMIVSDGVITARLAQSGVTGVMGVNGRFSIVNGIATLLPASNGESGIASFDSAYFSVSSTGHVTFIGELGGATGDTVLAGVAIGVADEGGNVRRINNIGVTSFNGLTGAVTLTGDGAAVFGAANNTIGARLATINATGVASFNSNFFDVTNGAVALKSPYSAIGVTGIGIGENAESLTGRVEFFEGTNITLSLDTVRNRITINSSAAGGGSSITANAQQVLYSSVNGGTGSNNFLFNGLAATFGGANTQFTITGPTFTFSPMTRVKEGVFVNPSEFAPWSAINSVLGNSSLQVRGDRGTVQRFTANPGTNFTVSADTSGWSTQTGVVETVIVAIQALSGTTGTFGSNVLTEFPRPVLLGVTGGVDVLSIMRIKTADGGVTMGFVVSRGMTAAGVKLSD